MEVANRRGEKTSFSVKLYIELSVIAKTSWNVSWLNYNMKHAQTLLKLLHRVALNKNKRHKLWKHSIN